MSETYIDVKPADVRVGDEVKVDGYGRREVTGELVDVGGSVWRSVGYLDGSDLGTSALDYYARFRRSSIVAARRRVEVVPDGEMCCASIPCATSPVPYMCSLRIGHRDDHIRYEHHRIGGKELGRAPNPPIEHPGYGPEPYWPKKPRPEVLIHPCLEPGCSVMLKCNSKCMARCDAHTPKEPKREPGCGQVGPDLMQYKCNSHEDGYHVDRSGIRIFKRWPIESFKVGPGTWRHGFKCSEVYRSTGWSPDTRTGQPWGAVEFTIGSITYRPVDRRKGAK